MDQGTIKLVAGTDTQAEIGAPAHFDSHDAIVARYLAAADAGDTDALFDLGVAFSSGDHGVAVDLIEAHKWFNLAAVAGLDNASACRADISEDMAAREISEAQRRAREWLRADAGRMVRKVA